MRQFVTAIAIVLACAGVAFAATREQAKPKAAAGKAAVASHSTAGVVKSVDSNSIVITRGNKDMTFTMNASTQKQGTVAPGSHVTVRYQNEGKTMVATAITEQTMAKATPKKK
jgi:hypothetical protein